MNDRTEDLLDYAHDRLDADARRRFEAELRDDAALRAELAVVEAVQREVATSRADQSARDAGWASLSAAIDMHERGVPANDNRRFSLAQVAAIAICAVLGSQFLTAPFWLDDPGSGWAPASQDAAEFVLQLAFADSATMGQISPLLQELGATIVDGPSAIGLITLSFADEAARTSAFAVLSSQTDLIDIVSQP